MATKKAAQSRRAGKKKAAVMDLKAKSVKAGRYGGGGTTGKVQVQDLHFPR